MLAALAPLTLAACQSSDVSRALGARCEATADCDDRCLPPAPDYPGGFCTRSCLDETECSDDASCADREGGVCLFKCGVDGDCAFLGDGWRCKEEDVHGGAGKVMVCRGG